MAVTEKNEIFWVFFLIGSFFAKLKSFALKRAEIWMPEKGPEVSSRAFPILYSSV
jgi:hypothetical protein